MASLDASGTRVARLVPVSGSLSAVVESEILTGDCWFSGGLAIRGAGLRRGLPVGASPAGVSGLLARLICHASGGHPVSGPSAAGASPPIALLPADSPPQCLLPYPSIHSHCRRASLRLGWTVGTLHVASALFLACASGMGAWAYSSPADAHVAGLVAFTLFVLSFVSDWLIEWVVEPVYSGLRVAISRVEGHYWRFAMGVRPYDSESPEDALLVAYRNVLKRCLAHPVGPHIGETSHEDSQSEMGPASHLRRLVADARIAAYAKWRVRPMRSELERIARQCRRGASLVQVLLVAFQVATVVSAAMVAAVRRPGAVALTATATALGASLVSVFALWAWRTRIHEKLGTVTRASHILGELEGGLKRVRQTEADVRMAVEKCEDAVAATRQWGNHDEGMRG